MKICWINTLIVGLVATFLAPPAAAQANEDEHKEKYRFEFEIDGDSLAFGDFAMHLDPPDLSALEDLDLHFREPLRFWSFGESPLLVQERMKVVEMERESRELARKARRAEGAERSELEAQLRDKLEEIFEVKLELRRERIDALEEKLRSEREKLRAREEARERLIERRRSELLGEDDALEW